MRTKKLVQTAFFTAAIMISAFIKIPMLPVPITMQSLFVVLAGLVLGSKFGAFAVLLYIISGFLGLPVFSGGGGFSYVLNPTFGFLPGFIISAFLVGKTVRKTTVFSISLHSFLCLIPTYIIGALYFYALTLFCLGETVSFLNVLYSCILIFIPGDILKCVLAGVLGRRIEKSKYL